ncbi:MAG: flagellar basal body rod protein FlgB [Epulopiscium sp.]|nr:flagellar basal body rod protein FlgB [Candidatus Epulonipiscium sp.]
MMMERIFNYSNILKTALDATYLRDKVISQNVANVDTPGYKKKSVAFEEQLQKALDSHKRSSQINLSTLKPQVIQPMNGMSYRMDQNNVDIDVETVEQTKNYLRYQALVDQVTYDMRRFKTVLNAR